MDCSHHTAQTQAHAEAPAACSAKGASGGLLSEVALLSLQGSGA